MKKNFTINDLRIEAKELRKACCYQRAYEAYEEEMKKITKKKHDELIKETKTCIKNILLLACHTARGLLKNEVENGWITKEEANQIALDLKI